MENKQKLSRIEKKRLLKESGVIEWLNARQILKLIWWENFSFSKNRIDAFYYGLSVGKSARYAFKDAENLKKPE